MRQDGTARRQGAISIKTEPADMPSSSGGGPRSPKLPGPRGLDRNHHACQPGSSWTSFPPAGEAVSYIWPGTYEVYPGVSCRLEEYAPSVMDPVTLPVTLTQWKVFVEFVVPSPDECFFYEVDQYRFHDGKLYDKWRRHVEKNVKSWNKHFFRARGVIVTLGLEWSSACMPIKWESDSHTGCMYQGLSDVDLLPQHYHQRWDSLGTESWRWPDMSFVQPMAELSRRGRAARNDKETRKDNEKFVGLDHFDHYLTYGTEKKMEHKHHFAPDAAFQGSAHLYPPPPRGAIPSYAVRSGFGGATSGLDPSLTSGGNKHKMELNFYHRHEPHQLKERERDYLRTFYTHGGRPWTPWNIEHPSNDDAEHQLSSSATAGPGTNPSGSDPETNKKSSEADPAKMAPQPSPVAGKDDDPKSFEKKDKGQQQQQKDVERKEPEHPESSEMKDKGEQQQQKDAERKEPEHPKSSEKKDKGPQQQQKDAKGKEPEQLYYGRARPKDSNLDMPPPPHSSSTRPHCPDGPHQPGGRAYAPSVCPFSPHLRHHAGPNWSQVEPPGLGDVGCPAVEHSKYCPGAVDSDGHVFVPPYMRKVPPFARSVPPYTDNW